MRRRRAKESSQTRRPASAAAAASASVGGPHQRGEGARGGGRRGRRGERGGRDDERGATRWAREQRHGAAGEQALRRRPMASAGWAEAERTWQQASAEGAFEVDLKGFGRGQAAVAGC